TQVVSTEADQGDFFSGPSKCPIDHVAFARFDLVICVRRFAGSRDRPAELLETRNSNCYGARCFLQKVPSADIHVVPPCVRLMCYIRSHFSPCLLDKEQM